MPPPPPPRRDLRQQLSADGNADPALLPQRGHLNRQGAVCQMPGGLAALAPQLPLADPPGGAGLGLAGQADQGHGVVVGQPHSGRGPGLHLEAGMPQPCGGGGQPGVAE